MDDVKGCGRQSDHTRKILDRDTYLDIKCLRGELLVYRQLTHLARKC